MQQGPGLNQCRLGGLIRPYPWPRKQHQALYLSNLDIRYPYLVIRRRHAVSEGTGDPGIPEFLDFLVVSGAILPAGGRREKMLLHRLHLEEAPSAVRASVDHMRHDHCVQV